MKIPKIFVPALLELRGALQQLARQLEAHNRVKAIAALDEVRTILYTLQVDIQNAPRSTPAKPTPKKRGKK